MLPPEQTTRAQLFTRRSMGRPGVRLPVRRPVPRRLARLTRETEGAEFVFPDQQEAAATHVSAWPRYDARVAAAGVDAADSRRARGTEADRAQPLPRRLRAARDCTRALDSGN